MRRIRISVHTDYGELQVEGDTLEDIRQSLKEIGFDEKHLEKFLEKSLIRLEKGYEQKGPSLVVSQAGIPPELIANLTVMGNKDVVLAILSLERTKATKKELITRSSELGRPIPESWMDKSFARDMKGLVTPVIENDQTLYKLTDHGKLVAQSRIEELAQPNR